MNRSKHDHVAAHVRLCTPEVILRVCALCDGHSILDPRAFTEAGLPFEVVAHLTSTYRSDGSPKGTIFVDGRVVTEVSGAYGLNVLRFLAHALDVSYTPALGRGETRTRSSRNR